MYNKRFLKEQQNDRLVVKTCSVTSYEQETKGD